jgi:hypothetical protein
VDMEKAYQVVIGLQVTGFGKTNPSETWNPTPETYYARLQTWLLEALPPRPAAPGKLFV